MGAQYMGKKRIALIGLGDIAKKVYLPLLSNHPKVELTAVMSRSYDTVEAIANQYRIDKKYNDLEMLLNQDLDAVFVHSPTPAHYRTVMECIQRGIHVYVDKPLSYEIEESIRMIEAAEKKDVLLAVGFNRRFAPRYLEAKEWFDEVGGFDHCIAQKHRTKQQKLTAKQTLYDDLIHMMDLLLWLGYGVQEVTAYTNRVDDAGRLMHTSGSLTFGKSSGIFSMNRFAGADLEKLEIHGGGRSAEITNLEHAMYYDKELGKLERTFGSWDTVLYRRGFQGIVDHFIESLDAPERCSIRGDQVLDTHLLIEKLAK
jgi:virulence factor